VILSGGETTVTVRKQPEGTPRGRGGRAGEFCLGLAQALQGQPGVWALAADTDGIDGVEDNAGAFVAPDTLARARAKGLKVDQYLDRNDAYGYFERRWATWWSPGRRTPTSTTSAPAGAVAFFGSGTPEYRQFAVAIQDFLLDKTFGDRFTDGERQQKIKEGIDLATVRMNAAKKLLTEHLDGSATAAPVAAPVVEAKPVPAPPPPAPPQPEPAPAPSPPPAPAPAPSSSIPERIPMPKTEFPSAPSATAPDARVAILGLGGDAVGEACEFIEQLGLEASILDAVSIDQLEGLRNVGFLLLLPGNKPDSPAAMLAIGFMLAALGRSRIACLLSEEDRLPDVLKGATSIAVDEAGLVAAAAGTRDEAGRPGRGPEPRRVSAAVQGSLRLP
jgi:hypothetical protein